MDRLLLESQQAIKLEAIRELRSILEKVTHAAVPISSIKQHILLCLSEATTNLVQHASSKTNQMNIRFGRNNHAWWLEILDNGTSWDPTKHVELDILDEFSETESGRGVTLLHKLCDHIEYYPARGSQLNRLRLNWKIPEQNKRPKILIVEDDSSLRRIYELYLKETFEVTTANSGRDALAKLKTMQIDLVLSDICMPQMDGVSLREHLIEDPDSRLIPFVFLTSVKDNQLMEQATNLGIDDYLIKPINKTQLIHTIQRVLKRSLQLSQQLSERLDKNITSSLTPRLPEQDHGWSFAVASRHTGSGGGDLLIHQSCENQFQLVLTDIMGHDDNAKFFAHVCGGYLHGMLKSQNTKNDSAYLLELLSDFATQDKMMSKVILTCCSAILSPGGKINLASAGHPPPLHISPKGIETVQVGGVLPGLLPATQYQSTQLKLVSGERIALYTDGLFESAETEVLRQQLEQRITSALADTLHSPINEALQQVMSIFDQLAGTPPKDDVLLVLMESFE